MSMHDPTLRSVPSNQTDPAAPVSPEEAGHSSPAKDASTTAGISVPGRLVLVNLLVVVSSFLGIIGAFEIHKGATFHELNYKHAKYITYFIHEFGSLDPGTTDLSYTRQIVEQIQEQPLACLKTAGALERAVLKFLGTYEAIELCERDAALAAETLRQIDLYKRGKIDWAELDFQMISAQHQFAENSELLGILISQTVNAIFFAVLVILILKGIAVPAAGLFLCRSVFRDYKKIEEMEAQLREERERADLIQAENLATTRRLVAGVSHEVNTPIGICVTAASHISEAHEIFKEKFADGSMRRQDLDEFVEATGQSAKILFSNLHRASELISSFKSLAVDQSSELQREFNIAEYLDEILLSLTPRVKRAKAKLSITCDPNLVADTYPGALSQIITNLVENSVAHAFDPGESGYIGITVASFEEAGREMVSLIYSDDGKGMDDATLAKLYEPYFTTKRGKGGTGLGMHILFSLVTENLQGEVNCSSKPGQGTSFIIKFPRVASNVDHGTGGVS